MKAQIFPIYRAIALLGGVNQLADAINCHPITIRHMTQAAHTAYHYNCSAESAIKIERVTNGKVKCSDIIPHLYA